MFKESEFEIYELYSESLNQKTTKFLESIIIRTLRQINFIGQMNYVLYTLKLIMLVLPYLVFCYLLC